MLKFFCQKTAKKFSNKLKKNMKTGTLNRKISYTQQAVRKQLAVEAYMGTPPNFGTFNSKDVCP